MPRKIAVITGTRADYGLLYLLLKTIDTDSALQLQLIVTGMHLSPEFGLTYRDIERDGFQISEKVEILLSTDSHTGISKSTGLGVLGFSDAYARLKPDLIVILGDRFEMLAAAVAAMFAKIPIAHIHGGELSQGALDDNMRHCITKLSHLHFTTAEPYRQRVIQLGEQPETVFNYGAPGIERLKKISLLDKSVLEKKLNFQFGQLTFLVTYHPPSLDVQFIARDLEHLFIALDAFPSARIIITKANADEAGRFINQQLDAYAEKNKIRVVVYASMGDLYYISTMRLVDVIIGNSSSGIIEAPTLCVPTVNIGDRQLGRLRAASVIDCKVDAKEMRHSIQKALSDEFKCIVKKTVSPYDNGNTAEAIKKVLKQVDLQKLLKKRFYEVVFQPAKPTSDLYRC